eukprot:gnl/Ergobibamus_cyprinoides/3919.p1 GENE.gnl/Ergobibamus_cyprinoides/3919~~gnl/Ergobibamus_cyprinoides/3919.p1  ORF type:complete len:269 (+),score=93.06 gnl/Ergobibamus_cyprinoides/3919:81-809(+)
MTERALKPDEKPINVKTEWTTDAPGRFVFKRQFIMDPQEDIESDPVFMQLMFSQVQYDVLHGRLFVSLELAVQLAAMTMQLTYGDHSAKHVSGFLLKHLGEFVPVTYLSSKAKKPAEWEALILAEHAGLAGWTPNDCMLAYLKAVRALPYFGVTAFDAKYLSSGKRKIGEHVYVGVSSKGVHILNFPTMEANGFTSYNDILSWGSSPNSFACPTEIIGYSPRSPQARGPPWRRRRACGPRTP